MNVGGWHAAAARIFVCVAVAIACCLAGCAVVTTNVATIGKPFHEFSFNLLKDSPYTDVLDYRYGGNGSCEVCANPRRVFQGELFHQTGVGTWMSKGEYLYVKWRDNRTGDVYEDRVDLRSRLPKKMDQKTVYFVPKGAVLYVYVIWPIDGHQYPPGELEHSYIGRKYVRIYPDSLGANH